MEEEEDVHRGEGDDPSSRWKRRIEGETQRMWAAVESGGTECAALQLFVCCCVEGCPLTRTWLPVAPGT